MGDLEFLKEIKGKIQEAWDKKDPTLLQYAQKMIDDWIDELEADAEPCEHYIEPNLCGAKDGKRTG